MTSDWGTQRRIKHIKVDSGWLAASRRWRIVATSARSSLPALLCAELCYNLRFHCGYLDPTTQTTSNTATTTTQERLLSLCSRGRKLGLGLRLGGNPGFQRGQWGLEGGWGWVLSIYSVGSTWSGLRLFVNSAREGGERGESSGGQTIRRQTEWKGRRPRETRDRQREMARERERERDSTSWVQRNQLRNKNPKRT